MSQGLEKQLELEAQAKLLRLVEKALFRLDLYHRFAVVKLEVPSLSQRPDDIIPMAMKAPNSRTMGFICRLFVPQE